MLSFFSNLLELLPQKPVLTTIQKNSKTASLPSKHTIDYAKEPLVNFPVLPFQVWAATYDLDIVLVSNHPEWNMHEFARLNTPKGDVWIMKDADEATRTQSIVTSEKNVSDWLPELPIQQDHYPVIINDKSKDKMLDLSFEYKNRAGELVQASYKGKYPKTKMSKRNGSTMGHSKKDLLVVLDLPVRDFGKKGSITYDGKTYSIKRLLGIKPFIMALQQTQAGLSTGVVIQNQEEGSLITEHQNTIKQKWQQIQSDSSLTIRQENEFRTINYEFIRDAEYLLLQRATVKQWDHKQQSFSIDFYPALPDFRYPFDGVVTSQFFMDVGTGKNHAIGTLSIGWNSEKELQINFYPDAPWWVKDRPLRSILTYDSDMQVVKQEATMRAF